MQALVLALLLVVVHVAAYIPAVPTNDTNAVNQSDTSMLNILWPKKYSHIVSYQLASNGSQGFQQGALVHFSEKNLTDQNTTTPWIALVNCDANTTDASQEDDIFTLARDRGAVAALLYSKISETCLINPEYASPENFEQILDIFATQDKSAARIIDSQFTTLYNNASFGVFNAAKLTENAESVNTSLATNNFTSPFIVATLRSANSTVPPNGTNPNPGPDSDPSSDDNAPRSNPNTGLAMIILYAITGCVSALFIVVILSGAIRAIRHPERYGPRAGGPHGDPTGTTAQSRTGGIGRAILDTFPIIKFGQATGGAPESKWTDVENQPRPMEMSAVEKDRVRTASPSSGRDTEGSEPELKDAASSSVPGTQVAEEEAEEAEERSVALASVSAPRTSDDGVQDAKAPRDDVRPDAIGHETCPICIVDFQEGDDLRVLPCEGKHKFHQTCVDPWLLELSSSCPLCREDFHALESMMAGNEAAEAENATEQSDNHAAAGAPSSRFSKYLKFARRRNHDADVPPDT